MSALEVQISEATLKKFEEFIKIDRFELEEPIDSLVSKIADAYSSIIICGLKELDYELTWKEFDYMLAVIIGADFISYDFNYIANYFISELIYFEMDNTNPEMPDIKDEWYDTEPFVIDINVKELVEKLKNVNPISCFALVALLQECLSIMAYSNDPRKFVEKQLRLKN